MNKSSSFSIGGGGSRSFANDRKSYAVTKSAALRFTKERDLLSYLYDSKPPCLRTGDFLSEVDKQMLDKLTKGVSDKFRIHGYPDRGERLLYLHSVLSKKLENKEDLLNTIIKLLLDMSERPTSVINLRIGTCSYSTQPDDEITDDDEKLDKRNKALLKELLRDDDDEGLEEIPLIFSSDSELSEWSSDDEESEKSKRSTNDIVEPDRNLKPSKTFSDFAYIDFPRDDDDTKQQMELYWTMEAIQAQNFLKSDLRKVTLRQLTNQPVISGLVTLHAKFGEYWEWKKYSNESTTTPSVISEEDVIREILWQFSSLNATCSTVFMPDWKIKPDLIISSTSKSAFVTLLRCYEKAFQTLTNFKTFVYKLEYTALNNASAVPKVLRSYAYGLSEIMLYISKEVGKVEKNLKMESKFNTQCPQPCTTLIQLKRQLQLFTDSLVMLDIIHTLSLDSTLTFTDEDTSSQWLCSIRLISSLAMHLNLQTQPFKFGIVFFLFSKCLHAFLDEINLAMSTLSWNENHLLFKRTSDVKLSDHNFWTDSIKQRPYESDLKESGISVPKCISKLIPEILIVIKTSEMLRQLDEDYAKILGAPPLACNIVDDFLEKTLFGQLSETNPVVIKEVVQPDYKTHFRFIGLEGSFVADSVKYILEQDAINYNSKFPENSFSRFILLDKISNVNIWEILDSTLNKWYGAHCAQAKTCMQNIFQTYKVDESMKVFQEIVLGAREDFAKSVVSLSSKVNTSERYRYEDEMNRNPLFQKLLIDCYPEGRENFDIEFKLDRTCTMNYTLVVKPHFPLNLILTDDSIDGYLFVSKQLYRIRKSLWEVTSLSMKDLKSAEDVEPNRAFLFRFALIHFCSSIRAYLVFKIFAKHHHRCATSAQSYDLDSIRKAYRDHLQEIETNLLRSTMMDNVVIRKMCSMSEALCKFWTRGIPNKSMILLEDTLKKCWNVVKKFHQSNYSTDCKCC